MTRPIHASIDLDALRHNLSVARGHAAGALIWAVVKANAYGHGLLRVARALRDSADGFALIELEGAIALRNAEFGQPILLLEGFYAADELPIFARYRLIPVVHSLHQVEMLVGSAQADSFQLPVYVKLNTGMNRLGLTRDEVATALQALEQSPRVGDIIFMTHFSDADCVENGQGIEDQLHRFAELRSGRDYPFSLANSAALLRFAEIPGGARNWVRAGILLYGASPFPQLHSAAALGLKPVMTLKSELIAVRDIGPGDRIGYGGTFVAPVPMKIGVVACGYADGYPRHAPTGTPVVVDGRRSRTLGRVSMDKLCVDLTEIDGVSVGATVVLWGDQLSADEVAAAAGTVSYELFCALAARVPVTAS